MAGKLAPFGLTLVLLVGGVGFAGAQPAAGPSTAGKPPAVSRFLAPGDVDPASVLPAPPEENAPASVQGRAELHRIAARRTPERLTQARRDDEIEDVRAFAGVLGPAFQPDRLPATAKLFRDLRVEDSVASKQAKVFFKRERPFHADVALDVCDDGHDVKNSYPSGHALMGYSAAAVLIQLVPSKAPAIQARATDYAESRLFCGVHYRSDVEASKTLAGVLVAKLMTKPAFVAEVEAARAELTAARLAP